MYQISLPCYMALCNCINFSLFSFTRGCLPLYNFFFIIGIPARVLTPSEDRDKGSYNLYREGLPSPLNLQTELSIWKYHWARQPEAGRTFPTTIQPTLKVTDPVRFPNIRKMMIVLLVLPLTTSE